MRFFRYAAREDRARRLNQSCATHRFLESILRVGMRKFFLQQYRHKADKRTAANSTYRKTASRRSLRNPIRCFDQLAIAAAFRFVAFLTSHSRSRPVLTSITRTENRMLRLGNSHKASLRNVRCKIAHWSCKLNIDLTAANDVETGGLQEQLGIVRFSKSAFP